MVSSVYEWWTEETGNVYQDTFVSTAASPGIAWIAQVFKVGQRGINSNFVLQEIKIQLAKTGTPSGNLTIEIKNVSTTTYKPTTTKATGTIAMSDIGASFAQLSCTNFTGDLNMTAGLRYAIVISHAGTATAGNYIKWEGDTTIEAPYSDYDANSHFWYSKDAGSTWTQNSIAEDMESGVFIVLGEAYSGTLTTYQDVINKAGSGANATARGATAVGNFVVQAENVINARTKYDWTTNYSSLSSNIKYFLNEIASNLAAIKVINYDMSGYTTRLEAEDMKNTLRVEAERYINELQKEDIKEFVKT